jgi:DNA-binding CsgD family transcriptional regulator/predicted phosphodiesterase
MAHAKVSEEEFIALFKELGSPAKVAKILGLSEKTVYTRRNRLEKIHGISLDSFAAKQAREETVLIRRNEIRYEALGQTIIVASDCHYWPGEATVAHQAFIRLCKQLKPGAIVLNGDVFDGARVSRHDPLYRNETPTVRQELEVCQERLGEIEKASHNSKLFWLYGNHDTRLWRYMKINAPEVEGAFGADLFDYFPGWHCGYVMHVNDNTVIKHRWHNGIHATYNNVLKGGRSIVTGHLHRLQVTAWGDYNGRRWGVDTGTLAEPKSEQFAYLEGNPTPWASGFAVLTFDAEGMLLPPELCEVINGIAYFRGKPV